MSDRRQTKRKKTREGRLVLVAELYRKARSYRQIQDEVKRVLELKSYSLQTVHDDVQLLLKEWREQRIDDTDLAVQSELAKIAWQEAELVDAWEKSKEDYQKRIRKQKGRPGTGVGKNGSLDNNAITTTELENTDQQVISFGDASYMAVLVRLREQRIKLIGLNAPDKLKVNTEETVTYDLSTMTDEEKALILKYARNSEQQG